MCVSLDLFSAIILHFEWFPKRDFFKRNEFSGLISAFFRALAVCVVLGYHVLVLLVHTSLYVYTAEYKNRLPTFQNEGNRND